MNESQPPIFDEKTLQEAFDKAQLVAGEPIDKQPISRTDYSDAISEGVSGTYIENNKSDTINPFIIDRYDPFSIKDRLEHYPESIVVIGGVIKGQEISISADDHIIVNIPNQYSAVKSPVFVARLDNKPIAFATKREILEDYFRSQEMTAA